MEQSLDTNQKGNRKAAALVWTFSAFAAAAAIIIALYPLTHGSAAKQVATTTQLRLPAQVTAANCVKVAKGAKLYKKQLSRAALGYYYSAWVDQLAPGRNPSRMDLFNAGVAVAVCLK